MKVPFSLIPPKKLKIISRNFLGIAGGIKPFFPYLELNLKQAESEESTREYLAMCITATLSFFIFIFFISLITTFAIKIENFSLISLVLALFLALFAFVQQTIYPRLIASRRIRDVDRNLLPALRNLIIHINSGIPLFDTILAVAREN